MRLFTFQNKACLSVLDKDVWQSTRSRRLKCVDNDYVDWDNDIYPIYTYASYGIKYRSCFGLHQLYSAYTTIFSVLNYTLDDIVMVELEVPEDFILSLKETNEWFEQTCDESDPDREDRRRVHREYHWVKRDLTKGTIYTKDYLFVVRQNRESSFEALIPCLRKEHIAAIREFKMTGGSYDTVWCKTIYTNEDLCPLWYGIAGLNGDGYPRFDKVRDKEVLSMIEELKKEGKSPLEDFIAQEAYGAKQVPVYFTLEEALACGNKRIRENIVEAIHMKGWSEGDIKHITMLGERV